MIHKLDIPALVVGIMSTLVSIGLARFSYTPILPELIQQGWFSDSDAIYLGAANLLGYLIGALIAHRLSERFSLSPLMAVCFFLVFLSFIGCAWPSSFEWFFIWRFIAGVTGAILMVVGPSGVIAITPPERRASIGTLMFTGIGIGALLSATIIPLIVDMSLTAVWLLLAVLVLLAGAANHLALVRIARVSSIEVNGAGRGGVNQDTITSPSNSISTLTNNTSFAVILVLIAYGFDALGFIPHTIFWVDYLSREQELGHQLASIQWGLFGLGAMCGPFIARSLAQRFGWGWALLWAFLANACAVVLPLFVINSFGLQFLSYAISSFIVGAMVPGIVSLTSGRIAELVGPSEHKKYWGWATAVFALAQAISGYVMSGLYELLASYYWLFGLGSGLLIVGLLLSYSSMQVKKDEQPV